VRYAQRYRRAPSRSCIRRRSFIKPRNRGTSPSRIRCSVEILIGPERGWIGNVVAGAVQPPSGSIAVPPAYGSGIRSPFMFTTDEVEAVTLGVQWVIANADADMVRAGLGRVGEDPGGRAE
jgi:hypothetical protein